MSHVVRYQLMWTLQIRLDSIYMSGRESGFLSYGTNTPSYQVEPAHRCISMIDITTCNIPLFERVYMCMDKCISYLHTIRSYTRRWTIEMGRYTFGRVEGYVYCVLYGLHRQSDVHIVSPCASQHHTETKGTTTKYTMLTICVHNPIL